MNYLTVHAADLFERSEYEIAATSFLSPAQQLEIFDALPPSRARLVFWGGAFNCERRRAFFVPEWVIESSREKTLSSHNNSNKSDDTGAYPEIALSFPDSLYHLGAFSKERENAAAIINLDGSLSENLIRSVHIEGSSFTELRHRDYMGAVLNLGVKRETLGDIEVLDTHSAKLYCTKRTAEVISSDLLRIGKDGVRVKVAATGSFEQVVREYEKLIINVASMRLDCIVGEVAKVSREGAKKLITTGMVELNHRVITNADCRLNENDVFSVRGNGKYRVGVVTGVTRKDRLRLTVMRYI